MKARVPASSSNLGPGFDVLGLALELFTEVTITPARKLTIRSEGEGAHFPADESHLAARIASQVIGHDRLEILVRSEIPPGRGLGSSAALALAVAAAAGATDPLRIASQSDGHPENAAASMLGGLVAATVINGTVVPRRLQLDESLGYVIVIPDQELSTESARAALPEKVDFSDAAFNLSRLGLLVAGLSDASELVKEAGEDRLHQHARAALFPEADALMQSLHDAGAIVACWSGAGPSLLGICQSRPSARAVAERAQIALQRYGVLGKAMTIEVNRSGLELSHT